MIKEELVPIEDRYLTIEGIASISIVNSLGFAFLSRKSNNSECYLLSFSYADIPIEKEYEVVFDKNCLDKFEYAKSRIVAVTQQFAKPMDELPHGWKTICIIEFENGIPELAKNLPIVDEWHESRNRIYISSLETFDAIRHCNQKDIKMIEDLIPHWYAMKIWAEELLCRCFNLAESRDILSAKYKGNDIIPGSSWRYRTHGVGVDIDRGIQSGGIDFDFDKKDPDLWRLEIFAEKQLNAGNLPDEYFDLINDSDRFKKAAIKVLSKLSISLDDSTMNTQ